MINHVQNILKRRIKVKIESQIQRRRVPAADLGVGCRGLDKFSCSCVKLTENGK